MTMHYLKLDGSWFERVRSGEKRAEIRLHDRDFQAGDEITFVGQRPHVSRDYDYTQSGAFYLFKKDEDAAREDADHVRRPHFTARITHVMVRTESTADFLPEGYCLLSIEVTPAPHDILRNFYPTVSKES